MTGVRRTAESRSVENSGLEELVTVGSRIPLEFFVTSGAGGSNLDEHTGSFHIALREAGIESFNVIEYSSILPGRARRIERPRQVEGLFGLVHGAVMEAIMARAKSTRGHRVTAGLSWGWLYDRSSSKKHGGLVCEYKGHDTPDVVERKLRDRLREVYEGYRRRFTLSDMEVETRSFVPRQRFGTALVAMCFVRYAVPVLGRDGGNGIAYPIIGRRSGGRDVY